jgi:subtilisin family serine protease
MTERQQTDQPTAGREKLEPRLRAHIEEERVRAARRGGTRADVDESSFDVTISHVDAIRAPEGAARTDRAAALDELARRMRESQRPIIDRIRELTGREPLAAHDLVNAVSARLTPPQMAAIAGMDEVELVRLERLDPVTCMNESVHVIEAPEAWTELDATGDDVRVALLDTGADKNHPALAGRIVSEVSTASEPITVHGNHGTHTAGTIVSNDHIYRGVAFEADLINVKVLTAFGSGQPMWVIQGITEALRRDAQVVSMSLGWSEIYHGWVCNDADCILCQAADNAVSLGLVMVVAAGNENGFGARPPFAIRHPGAARKVITVGAVDKAKELATFSSTGPCSGRLSPASSTRITKPDVCAPGVNIVSSVLGGGFGPMSGTSMATPHVAGVAAQILEKEPDLTPMQVKRLLEESCQPLLYMPNQVGYGLISAYGSVLRVMDID